MADGTTLVAKMTLQISEYQAAFAQAKAEANKFRQDLIDKGADLDKKLFDQIEKHKLDLSRARQEVDDIRAMFKAKGDRLDRDLFEKLEKHKLDLSKVKEQLASLHGSGGGSGGASMGTVFGGTFAANVAYDAMRKTADEMRSFVERGIQFNYVIDNSEVGIANVLKKFDGLNAVAAKDEAAKALKRLVELEPETAGTLQDLTLGFMKTLSAAKGVGLTTAQNVELTAKFANAVSNAGLSLTQITQEYRSILTETITKDSQLAKILGITNDDVKGIRTRGEDLFAFLEGKLGDMANAGDSAQVAWSSFQSGLDKAAGAFTAGLFTDGLQHAKDLSKWLAENKEEFTQLGREAQKAMQLAVTGMKMLVTETSGLRAGLETARQWFGDSLGDFIFGETEYRQMKAMNKLADEQEEAMQKILKAQQEIRNERRAADEEWMAREEKIAQQAKENYANNNPDNEAAQRAAYPEKFKPETTGDPEKDAKIKAKHDQARQELADEMRAEARRAAGFDAEAEAQERLNKIAKMTLDIQDKTNVSAKEAARLAEARVADQEAIKDLAKDKQEQDKQDKEQMRLREKYDEAHRRDTFEALSLNEKIAATRQNIQDEEKKINKAAAAGETTEQLEALIRQAQEQQELTKLVKERARAEKQSTEELARQTVAAERLKTAQMISRQELTAEMKIADLRLHGREREADEEDRKLRIAREALNIKQRTGLSDKESLAKATTNIDNADMTEYKMLRAAGVEAKRPRGGRHHTWDERRDISFNHGRGSMAKPWQSGPSGDDEYMGMGGMSRPLTTGGGIRGFDELQLGFGALPGRSGRGDYQFTDGTRRPLDGVAKNNEDKANEGEKTVGLATREFETLKGIRDGIDNLLA